jgi:hypothetical protein
MAEVAEYLYVNGARQYKLSQLYDEPTVAAAVGSIATAAQAKAAA